MIFIQEINEIPHLLEKNKRPEDLIFTSLSFESNLKYLSPLAQYFIAPYILQTSEICTIIPAKHIEINEDMIQQHAC